MAEQALGADESADATMTDEPSVDELVHLARQAALKENNPYSRQQAYELFDEFGGHCSPPLPVQISADRFTFVELIALSRRRRPITLPLYWTFAAEQLSGLVEPVRLALVSESPLLEEWAVPEELNTSAAVPIELRAPIRKLIAERRVMIGEGEPIELSAENLRQLLLVGRTGVRVGEGGDAREYIILADRSAVAPLPSDLVLRILDVTGFLARPLLPNGERIDLSEDQAATLLDGGSVVITVDMGGNAVKVTLMRAGIGDLEAGHVAYVPPSEVAIPDLFDVASGFGSDNSESASLPSGYEFALWCPHRQLWSLLGYTRGELLNSIPLAPQEETTIEIFSWDRRRGESEVTSVDEAESLMVSRDTIKDSDQVVREAQRQRSWTANGKGDIGVRIKVVNLGGEAGGTMGKQLNDSARRTHDDVVEATDEATQRVKSTRQTRVTETAELGSETRVTRSLRNLNMTRTLTFDYFEMLATYAVETGLNKGDIRLCLFVDDVLPGKIDRYFVLHNEGALRAGLLSDRYEAGFDAVRLLARFEATCEIACGPGCACEETQCLCEPAPTSTPETGSETRPQSEPSPGTARTCIALPLPILPGHSLQICRDGNGPLSVRLSGTMFNVPLAGDGEGPCLRFPVPVPLPPPVFGFVDVCLGGGGQLTVRAGTAIWLPFAGLSELFSIQLWRGQLGGGSAGAGAGATGTPPGSSTGTSAEISMAAAGGCAGCAGPLPNTTLEQLTRLADAVAQLELATKSTISHIPADPAAQPQWTLTLHAYLYRTLALETACPAFWERIRAWAFAYQSDSPHLALLNQALHEPRDRVVTMAMLPHAMIGDYARLIQDINRVVGFPRSDFVIRYAGFHDQGFESALTQVRSALTAVAAQPCATDGPMPGTVEGGAGTPAAGVAGSPLGSGNWSIEELAKRLLNPILWTVEKLYEGWTTDETPPDLSFIENGGIGAALTAAAVRIAREGPLPTRIRGFDVQQIAEAIVLEQQLLGHLSANESHYRQAVWNAMDSTDRYNLLTARGDRLVEYVDDDAIAFVGRKAVLPFRVEADARVAAWFSDNVLRNDEVRSPSTKRIKTVPTKGINLQARLGLCDAAESFIVDLRAAEVQTRKAEAARAKYRAKQAKQEAKRRKLRLSQTPPNLGDPLDRQGPIHVALETHGGADESDNIEADGTD